MISTLAIHHNATYEACPESKVISRVGR